MRRIVFRWLEVPFSGCGIVRFTEAHHVRWWRRDGGKTTLENLVLICSFHHRLVHEHGWRIGYRGYDAVWLTPSGTRWRAEPTARAPDERIA